jgi:MFS family permease
MCAPKGNFVLLALIYAFTYAGGGFVGIFIPVLLELAGLSSLQVGLVAASSPVAGVIGVIVLGWLFDRKKTWRKQVFFPLAFFVPFFVNVLFWIAVHHLQLHIVCVFLLHSVGGDFFKN